MGGYVVKVYRSLFIVLTCFIMLFFLSAKGFSQTICAPGVMLQEGGLAFFTIMEAYDHALINNLNEITLKLAAGSLEEDLTIDGNILVVLEGGYDDCSFTGNSSITEILGSITISAGTLIPSNIKITSPPQCAFDTDGDGYTSIGSCTGTADDCNDNNANAYPGAPEICDGLDNNCDGQADEGLAAVDADDDGYSAFGSCGGSADDCDDNNGSIHPGAVEIYHDGIDQNCDGKDLSNSSDALCSNCHEYDTWIEPAHFYDMSPDGSCASCHATAVTSFLDSHYGKAVRTAGNNMAAGATIGCISCHDVAHYDYSGGAEIVWPKVLATWNGQIYVNLRCDTCHESQAALHVTGAAHNNRIINNSCGSCHTSDTSVLGSPGNGTLVSDADVDILHRSDCALCHNYTGTKIWVRTVEQAIEAGMNGTPVTCTDCHTDKGTNHGGTSGKHPQHLALAGVGCDTCHGTIPLFKDGLDLNGTNVCYTCHQDATGNPNLGIKAGWDNPNYFVDCFSCHGLFPHTGSHDAHEYLHNMCSRCHDGTWEATTAPEQHLDGNIDVYDSVPGDLGYPVDKAIGGTYDSCASSYCHSTVQGVTDPTDPPTYVASPAWGTPFAGVEETCTGCHNAGGHVGDTNSLLTSGSHARHLQFRFDQDATCNACHFDYSYTGCTTCHQRQVSHADNNIDVVFNPGFPMSAESSSGAYTGDPAPRTPYGTCSSLYCHSPGTKASAPYDTPNVTSLGWGGAVMPADCTGCHNGDSAAAQPMATGSHALHIGIYDCSKCHANTVDNSRSLNATIYPPKNYTYGQRYHVDGWVTVAFSSDIAATGAYAGASSPTVYRAPGSAPGSCANTYCHSDGSSVSTAVIPENISPDWGTGALSCDGCHSYPPAYSSGSPKANSHAAHSGFTCDACHFSTTATGDTITYPHNHANQVYDVQARGDVTFDYTFDSNGGTCSNVSCHGEAVWGQSVAHTVEVGPSDLANGTPCGTCHIVADWTEIEGTEHNVATNGPGSCATCHNSPRQEVIDTIALGVDPTYCLDCHSDKTAAHGSVDHVAYGYVTLSVTPCGACHDPGSAENATVDATHNGDCTLCHTTVPNLQPGVPAGGGDCASCHGSDVQTVHPSCTTCHGEPPDGSTSPNTEGAHTEHNALGFGSVSPSCGACHDEAAHYNGATDVDILSNFDARSGPAVVNADGTCSSTRCHGGQRTPSWYSTTGIDVNTQCTSCHAQGTMQYNSFGFGDRHYKHISHNIDCWSCHNTTILATGHFSNLETTTFDQDPADTIGGTPDLPADAYNVPNQTCTVNCHNENHDNESWEN
jgi:predicted CxxxxCH...CXXCH cytochrome family protein